MKEHAVPCPQQPPTRDDNTVLVAQDTPGTTCSFSHQKGYLKELYIYIYIYVCMPDQLKEEITLLHYIIFSAIRDL